MLERFVLFITNSGDLEEEGSENPIVSKTIANYTSYFKSSYGGWWDKSEIFHVEQPDKDFFVERLPGLNQYPYSIIVFCGPVRSEGDELYLAISSDFEISATEINEEVNKRILIIDDIGGSHSNYTTKLQKLNLVNESLYGLVLNTIECKRLLLHKNLKECPDHTVTLYTSKTPVSTEIGSFYAAFLLKTTRTMIKEKYQSIDFTKEFGFLRFPPIHAKTIELMEEYGFKTSNIELNLSNEVNHENESLVFAIVG